MALHPSPGAGALAGLRVLDLSRVLAGPMAAQTLADLGAEVIKVERPGRGDDTREWAPPFVGDGAAPLDESAYFWTCNRGKRSVAADLASAEGRALVANLAARADVLIENYKVGALRRYGLDYPTLSAANPRLVYCSITGFGQTGPYADRPGYDSIAQAMGGVMSVTGDAEGGPRKVGLSVVDLLTALHASTAILAALRERESSGLGQHLDLALLDVAVWASSNLGTNFLATGEVPKRTGNRQGTVYPSGDFPCADGDLVVIAGNDGQFRALCGALGHPEWAEDPRFATTRARVRHVEALGPMIAAAMRGKTRAEWQALLDASGVPTGPINDLAEVFADPQVQARGMVQEAPLGHGKTARVVANPVRMSRTPPRRNAPAPKLGAGPGEWEA